MADLQQEKVIVFGGAGFIGSHVCDQLAESGYEVTVFDTKETEFSRADQAFIQGDILDSKAVQEAIEGHDYAMNFAGIADIGHCKDDPVLAGSVNIMGTINVLKAAADHKLKRFLFASSAYVYSQYGSVYKNTKQACELFIDTFQKDFGLDYTIIRYGSLYGSRSDERNSIYRIIRQALSEKKISYKGTGDEIREYIHVVDAARLTVDIMQGPFLNQHIVLTGNQTMRYGDLLTMIREMLNNDVEIEYLPKDNPDHYEITPYSFSPKLGRKLVNNPHIDMGQGLLEIMESVYREMNGPHI